MRKNVPWAKKTSCAHASWIDGPCAGDSPERSGGGTAERRHSQVVAARNVLGVDLHGVRRDATEPVAGSELHLDGGWTLALGLSHSPSVDRLADALHAGPVRLAKVADHRRFFGLYFQTCWGQVGLLVTDLDLRASGGGLRRSAPELVLG